MHPEKTPDRTGMPALAGGAERPQIAARRARVAELCWARLWTVDRIAAYLGCGTTTVYDDLVALRSELVAYARSERHDVFADHIAKLLSWEAEALSNYESAQSLTQKSTWWSNRLEVLKELSKVFGITDKALQVTMGDGGKIAIVLPDFAREAR